MSATSQTTSHVARSTQIEPAQEDPDFFTPGAHSRRNEVSNSNTLSPGFTVPPADLNRLVILPSSDGFAELWHQ